MKVLLTGLTGFIGQSLQPLLPAGHEYYAIVRPGGDLRAQDVGVMRGDLNNLEGLKADILRIRPELCIHLAWEGIPDYGQEVSRKNLEISSQFFQLLVDAGCRKIVSSGSCWEYGKEFGPCREDEPVGLGSHFVWAKRALYDFGMSLSKEKEVEFVWLRFFFVYGPGQRQASLIPSLVGLLEKGEFPQVHTPGNANDFVYVDDTAGALVKAAFHQVPSGIYNVGSGAAVPVWQVCAMIEEALGQKTKFYEDLKLSGGRATANFWADTQKTKKMMGWQAETGLKEGIQKYLRHQEAKQ